MHWNKYIGNKQIDKNVLEISLSEINTMHYVNFKNTPISFYVLEKNLSNIKMYRSIFYSLGIL